MGLVLVQRIINEAGVVIEVKNTVNAGFRFEILLPVTEKEKQAGKKYSYRSSPGRATFLLSMTKSRSPNS